MSTGAVWERCELGVCAAMPWHNYCIASRCNNCAAPHRAAGRVSMKPRTALLHNIALSPTADRIWSVCVALDLSFLCGYRCTNLSVDCCLSACGRDRGDPALVDCSNSRYHLFFITPDHRKQSTSPHSARLTISLTFRHNSVSDTAARRAGAGPADDGPTALTSCFKRYV